MENLKIFINQLADMSGDYIAKNFGSNFTVDYKKDTSPVTQIDKNTELMIREAILKKFPTHGIIGEEFESVNSDSEYQWVIDPIDGTKSFICGVPLFGTLIGLKYQGEPILGVIDQPILKERIVGDGKTCLFNGKQVYASKTTQTKGMTLLTSDSRACADIRSSKGWYALEREALISRTWGDCYGYMLVCRGYADVMCDEALEVWDLTALIPALKGSGAVLSDWYGKDNIGIDGFVASCNDVLHKKVIDILNQ